MGVLVDVGVIWCVGVELCMWVCYVVCGCAR